MSTAQVTLKLTSEQFRGLRSEIEALIPILRDEQDGENMGSPAWQEYAQRIMFLESLLRTVL